MGVQVCSFSVAVPAASLSTQAMFTATTSAQSRQGRAGHVASWISSTANGTLRVEFEHWLSFLADSYDGSWFKVQHHTAEITAAATDASSAAWGGVGTLPDVCVQGEADSPWLRRIS